LCHHPDSLKFLAVTLSDFRAVKDQGVFIVVRFSAVAEIVRASDHDMVIDEDHFMVHAVGVALEDRGSSLLSILNSQY